MYSFNSERVTWQEAEVLCHNKGSYLAVVSELQEAAFIMQASQDYHDLWVGGHWNNDHWYWSHTGEVIRDVGGFPVWARNFTRSDHDCLNLYRGAKEQAVLFVDRQCNETHGFVCEEALNGEEGLVEELQFRGNIYHFTNMRMTWNDAYDVCANNDSMLPVVFDRETAIFLAEAGREYHDMWLGGHVEEGHWAWKPKNRRIPTTSGEHEFPEWVRASPRPDHDCLSLYRDTENKPMFLDRKCDEKQVIVCQKYNTILGEALETFEYADRHFTFLRRPEIWSDAVDICKLNGSFLPILTDETLTRFIAEKTDSVPEIWTDGHSRDSLWFWELTSEEVPMVPDEDGFPAWARDNPELDCLALDMTAVNNPVFSDVDCYQPRPFVCETGCVPLGHPKQGHWSRPECYTNVARHGEECELLCDQGAELWGRKRLTCGKNRWGNTFSSCIGTEHLGGHFVTRLNLTLNAVNDVSLRRTGLLFVLAKSSNMGQSNFNSVQEFTKSVAASVHLAPNLVSSGVITFGSSPKLAVPLSTSDICTFFELVDQITYEYDDGDNLDYNQVLELAKSVIDHTSLIQRTVIVLLVDGLSSSELGSIVSDMKALGTIFFTVGIGDVNGDVLEQIASTPMAAGLEEEEQPNFYYLSSFTAFGEMVNFLNETYLYSGNIDCCMRLQEQMLGTWSPPSCSQTHGVLNSTCSMTCREGFELVGDPSLTCTPRGWFGFMGKAHVPTCHSIVAVAHLMFDGLENELAQFEKVAILFLLDHSNSMTNDDFVKQTSFVKMMINRFLLSEDRVAGLITFNTHAAGIIPLNTSKTCSFLVSLEKVKFRGGGTNFEAALIAAEEEINKYDMNNQTIIFLMTDGRSQGNPRNVADRLKSKGNVIFTLGVGGYKRLQLEPISSIGRKNKKPNFFSVSDFQALQEAVSYINNSCMTLSQKLSGTWSPGECSTTPSEESDNCSILCDPGYGLFGSPKVTCTRTGWSQVTTACFAKADTISQLISNNIRDTIDSFDGVDALLFIVDQTDRLEKDSFTLIIEFIKAIITRFPLHDKHTAGLISNHKTGSDIDILINTKKTCSFLDKLSGVKFMRGSPSLGKALKLAKKIEGYDRENATLIILITDRQMIPSTTLNLARKLRSSNKKILVIAVDNRDARPHLLAISSDNNRTAQNLISLDSYDTLEAVTEFMMGHEHLLSWYADTGYLYPNCAEL
uniref:Uncharacterized protein n=1 Tax=Timema monikensis TaxID=170555 RepID=A0A7R9EK69_9NEOP|nr:unnamed protein product [Timema monikensis]